MESLKGKTLFITGASRGIGKAIGLRAASDGANIVIASKTAEKHPRLPGTIYTAAEEMMELVNSAVILAPTSTASRIASWQGPVCLSHQVLATMIT